MGPHPGKIPQITPQSVAGLVEEALHGMGTSLRKAGYIVGAVQSVLTGGLELEVLRGMSNGEVCSALVRLRGVGVWTAEMLLIFSMQRPDVMSCGDPAIQRGLRMLRRHRRITPQLFEKYRRRYSPCGSVASLYLRRRSGGHARLRFRQILTGRPG